MTLRESRVEAHITIRIITRYDAIILFITLPHLGHSAAAINTWAYASSRSPAHHHTKAWPNEQSVVHITSLIFNPGRRISYASSLSPKDLMSVRMPPF